MDSSAIVEKTRIKVANKSEKVHQMHIRAIVDKKAGVWGQESLILFLVSGAAEGRKVLDHPRAKSHPFTLPLVRVSGFEITPKSFATEGKIMAADALTPFLSFPSPLSTRPAHTPFNFQVSRCFVIIFSSSQSASYLYRWKQF